MLHIAHCKQHAYLVHFIAFVAYVVLLVLYSVYDFYHKYIISLNCDLEPNQKFGAILCSYYLTTKHCMKKSA